MAKKKKFSLLTALTGLSFETEETQTETSAEDLIAKLAAKAKAEGKSLPIEKDVVDAPVKPMTTADNVEQSLADQEARKQRAAVTDEIMGFIMEEVNQDGMDFAEFLERLDSIRQLSAGTNMSEEQLFKLAHLEFKGQAKRSYLLSTATFYKNALKSTFFERAKSELKKTYDKEVKGFKVEANKLRGKNEQIEKQIKKLHQEIADNIKKAGELEAKAAQQDISIQHKKVAYESVIPAIMGQIDEASSKIRKYIEADPGEESNSQ
ncbi:MAG: hypothetical protein AAF696_34000 [Bacteroidota bacterium]